MIEQIKQSLSLSNYEVNQLSCFDAAILKKAWQRLQGKSDTTNKFRYLLKAAEGIQSDISKGNEQQKKGISSTGKQITPYKRKRIPDWETINTAVAIAAEIAKIKAIDASKMVGGEGYKQRMLINWAHKDYTLTNEDGEDVAIMFIEAMKKEYSFDAQNKPAEIKPQLNTIKDNSLAKYIAQTFKKDSANSNVVQFDNTNIDYSILEEDFSNLEL